MMVTAPVSAAWAYGETMSASTKTATATLRPYDEGIRPIIPRGYRRISEGGGIRGEARAVAVVADGADNR